MPYCTQFNPKIGRLDRADTKKKHPKMCEDAMWPLIYDFSVCVSHLLYLLMKKEVENHRDFVIYRVLCNFSV